MHRIRRWTRIATLAGMASLAGCPWDSTKPRQAVGLAYHDGNGQVAIAGTALSTPPSVKVIDENGYGVPNVDVAWTITTGGGSLSKTTTVSDGDGVATAGTWTLGRIAGTNSLTASATGIAKTITFVETGSPGAPAKIIVEAGADQTSAANTTLSTSPMVRVVDANGNPIGGVLVTFTVTAGGGTVSGSRSRTDNNGLAIVGSWTLGAASGTNSLSAAVQGLPAKVINAFATPPATQLVVNTQPGNAVTGEPMEIQPVVSVRDEFNDLVTTGTVTVTASIGSGTGTLAGVTSIFAQNGIATFSNLTVTGTSPITLRFTSTGLAEASSETFTPAPTPPLNLTIDGLHLNQATQSYGGSVPIVAGRAALARVFVKANTINNTATPSVRVRTFRNGSLFREYNIDAPRSSVPKTIDEQSFTSSWNVVIPANEVVTGMSILAEVDPAGAVTESSETDNAFPASGPSLALDVRQVSTMKATFIPITQPGVAAGNINESNKYSVLDYAMRVYPFDTADVVIHQTFSYDKVLNGASYDDGWSTLLNQIAALQTTEGATDRYYYGIAHPGYSSGGTGLGRIGEPAAIGMDFTGTVKPNTNYYNMTIAHEWGHNFGRNHVACGNPSGPDLAYPYDTQTIGVPVGSQVAVVNGYDLAYNALYKAGDYKEFMSYCQPLWISDYTYKAVLDWRASHGGAPAGANQDVLLIWGRVGPSGVVLEPAYEIQGPVQLPTESGPYMVQGLDDAGRSLFTISFAGAETDHVPGGRTFAYAVPLPASGARPATLRLMRGTAEVARRSRPLAGANRNAVPVTPRLVRLGGSEARVEWDATTYPGAMVRDAATGQVLGFLRGGSGVVVANGDVDVLLSNGVGSARVRVSMR